MAYDGSSAGFLLRMSPEQKAQFAAEAEAHGMTMRAWAMYRIFGLEGYDGKPGRKPTSQEPLPMTG